MHGVLEFELEAFPFARRPARASSVINRLRADLRLTGPKPAAVDPGGDRVLVQPRFRGSVSGFRRSCTRRRGPRSMDICPPAWTSSGLCHASRSVPTAVSSGSSGGASSFLPAAATLAGVVRRRDVEDRNVPGHRHLLLLLFDGERNVQSSRCLPRTCTAPFYTPRTRRALRPPV